MVEAHHGCFSPPLSLPLFPLFSHVLVTIQGRLLSDVKLKFQKIPIAPTQGVKEAGNTGRKGEGWTVELVPRWSYDSLA